MLVLQWNVGVCLHANGYVTVNSVMFWFVLYALQRAKHTCKYFMGAILKEYLDTTVSVLLFLRGWNNKQLNKNSHSGKFCVGKV